MLRELQSNYVGSLVVVPGIITAASKTSIKATKLVIRCSNCGHEKSLKVNLGFSARAIPRICDNQKNPGPNK
jgi:DNA replication licensing factor MCM5